MCTDFCICEGLPTDTWVKSYGELPDATYDKYNRTKTGYKGEIDLAAFSNKDKKKPLFWTYEPKTGAAKQDLVDLASKSFIECIDNMDAIVEKY
jgi:hypothetical protein